MTDNAASKPFNAFSIKVLACLFMLTDHIGWQLFPGQDIWRLIGRLAFPLFAFMIANGWLHSRDRGKYFLRLALCALLIQWPYWKFISSGSLNIFFTLSLGLAAIWLWERQKESGALAGGLSVLAVALIAEVVGADYGWYGVLLIFTSHLFYGRTPKLFAAWLALNAAFMFYVFFAFYTSEDVLPAVVLYQPFSLLALLIIANYNGRKGRKGGWLFYVFYPLHLAVIYLVGLYL